MKYGGLFMDVEPGERLDMVANDAADIAKRLNAPVYFQFNDTVVHVRPGMTGAEAIRQWVEKRSARWPELS